MRSVVVWPRGKFRCSSTSTRSQTNAFGQMCTGSVIGPNQFLTAAHRIFNQRTARIISPQSVHILLRYEKGGFSVHRLASRYIMSPGLDTSLLLTYPPEATESEREARNDWVIVYTDEPFPSDVRPLRLARSTVQVGSPAKIGRRGGFYFRRGGPWFFADSRA